MNGLWAAAGRADHKRAAGGSEPSSIVWHMLRTVLAERLVSVTAIRRLHRVVALREETGAQVGQRGLHRSIVAAVTHDREGSYAQVHGFPR